MRQVTEAIEAKRIPSREVVNLGEGGSVAFSSQVQDFIIA